MEVVYKKLDEIKPYANNPRKNDQAVDYVANSIKEFGFRVPIVIDKDGVIIAGHTRYKASKKLGLKEVPCVVASDLSEEQVDAFRLADNKVAEQSEWDYGKLMEELKFVDEEMMDLFDLDYIEFEDNEEKEVKEKEDKENYYRCPSCETNILESDLIVICE